jgi:flagellar motility protein MotE (MotC chaperone)
VISSQSAVSDQQSAVSSQQQIKAKSGVRAKGWSTLSLVAFFIFIGLLLIAQSSLLIAANAPVKQEEKKAAKKAEAEVKAEVKAKTEIKTETKAEVKTSGEIRTPDMKRSQLAEKEEALKKEEERIKILRKELDEKIDRYTKLLARMEEVLKSMDTAKGEQYEHLVKTYEAMPNEEAAARLSALDEQTAVKIIVRMKSKKAGAVMAAMAPNKVAVLTEGMISITKKFPTR